VHFVLCHIGVERSFCTVFNVYFLQQLTSNHLHHLLSISLEGPDAVTESQDTCLMILSRDCLETWFFMSRFRLSINTCVSCLGSVSSFHVSSCLTSHDYVLPVSLSCMAKCLLWPPCVADAGIIFSSCGFFYGRPM